VKDSKVKDPFGLDELRIANGLDQVVEVTDEDIEAFDPVATVDATQVDFLRQKLVNCTLDGHRARLETGISHFIRDTLDLNRDNIRPTSLSSENGGRWPADPAVRELHMELVSKFEALVDELGDVSNDIGIELRGFS
jgi:hypothetical protein